MTKQEVTLQSLLVIDTGTENKDINSPVIFQQPIISPLFK